MHTHRFRPSQCGITNGSQNRNRTADTECLARFRQVGVAEEGVTEAVPNVRAGLDAPEFYFSPIG
jgi:hypothetical protein